MYIASRPPIIFSVRMSCGKCSHILQLHPIITHYRYEASAQDVENGVLRMHRTVNSEDIEAYTSHIPGAEVELRKKEDITYKKGVLLGASGTTTVKLFGKV